MNIMFQRVSWRTRLEQKQRFPGIWPCPGRGGGRKANNERIPACVRSNFQLQRVLTLFRRRYMMLKRRLRSDVETTSIPDVKSHCQVQCVFDAVSMSVSHVGTMSLSDVGTTSTNDVNPTFVRT